MPHVKWYGRDWLGDPLLRLVGPAEKGVWIDLLCAMMNAEPYGHLAVNGKPMLDEDAARLTGTDVTTYKTILSRLEAIGIPSRTPDGILFSRRLVRDYAAYKVASRSGKKGGGNPALRKTRRLQNPESRSQKPEATVPLADMYKGTYKGKSFKQWTEAELLASVTDSNHDHILTPSEATDFVAYWCEPTPSGRFRIHLQPTWDTRRRMNTALDMIYSKRRVHDGTRVSPRAAFRSAQNAALDAAYKDAPK